MNAWAAYGGVALVAYLLGSIPSGVIAARAWGRTDVRTQGSGHTGALNTYRAAGLAPALLTLLADGAKGVLAVSFARWWLGEDWAVPLAATLAVLGHCYPIFIRGRGGMGLTTAGGALIALEPLATILLIVAWFPLKRLLRESTYASIGVALALPALLLLLRADEFTVAAGIGIGAVLIGRHLQVILEARRLAVRET
jgi:acyl phosphate:glycerol-3-phosphate acyltransferase